MWGKRLKQIVVFMNVIVSPSILSADFGNLEHELRTIDSCDWIHVDVMDGVFVPNISIGFPVIKSVARYTDKPLDVHLMIVDPDRYIERCRECGSHLVTVHYEACRHLHRTVMAIKDAGMKAGVSLNPHTPVGALEEILPYLDLVLLMSVNPGYGGQAFIETSVQKVARLRRLVEETGAKALIEVDGGVNAETGRRLVEVGADALVAGNYVFSSSDRAAAIASLKQLG